MHHRGVSIAKNVHGGNIQHALLQRIRRYIAEGVQVCGAVRAVQRLRLITVFRLRINALLSMKLLARTRKQEEWHIHRSNDEPNCEELDMMREQEVRSITGSMTYSWGSLEAYKSRHSARCDTPQDRT